MTSSSEPEARLPAPAWRPGFRDAKAAVTECPGPVDVLVVDDDEAIRHLLAAVLRREGYSVRLAADGREVLPLLQHGARLLVTDIFMPHKDGLEVIMETRRVAPELPILAMSGGGVSGGPDLMLLPAHHLGCRRTLEKPFELAEFVAAVRALLGGEDLRALPP